VSTGPGRNIDVLARLIHLPARPLEAWYESIPIGTPGGGWGLGPTDYDWVIVMRFDRSTLTRLTADLPRSTRAARFTADTNRPWFPPDVRAAIVRDGGDLTARGQRFESTLFCEAGIGCDSFIVLEGGEYVLLTFSTT